MHVEGAKPGLAGSVGRVAPAVPGASAAVPVGEAALCRVSSSHDPGDPSATAVALLRQVEALLRSIAPPGTSPEDLGAAAARLVERQGLVARLNTHAAAQDWSVAQEQTRIVGEGSSAVDKKL